MGIPAAVSQAPPAGDRANAVVAGQFTGTGQSPSFLCWGPYNLVIYGSGGPNGNWDGTVRLERSFDGGTTWIVGGTASGSAQLVWSAPNEDVSVTLAEVESGVLTRLNCTAYTSGTINYRLSATGGAALSWVPNI